MGPALESVRGELGTTCSSLGVPSLYAFHSHSSAVSVTILHFSNVGFFYYNLSLESFALARTQLPSGPCVSRGVALPVRHHWLSPERCI